MSTRGVRGKCGVCRRDVPVRQDGLLWVHRGHFRGVCAGSQTEPVPPPAEVVYGPPCGCPLCDVHGTQTPDVIPTPGHFRKDVTP